MANTLPSNMLPDDIFEQTENDATEAPQVRAENPVAGTSDVVAPTPTPDAIDKALESQSVETKEPEIPEAMIKEVRREIMKEDQMPTVYPVKEPLPQRIITPPTSDDIQTQRMRTTKGKGRSAFLRIVLIIITVGVVFGVGAVSYYYFLSRSPESGVEVPSTESIEPVVEVPEEVIDTSQWNKYANAAAGITFRYPEYYTIERYDASLGQPNASSTPQLRMQSTDGNETLFVWIDTVGIAHFTEPNFATSDSPLTAGVHYVLAHKDDRVMIDSVRYLAQRSGVIRPNAGSIVAYTPQNWGVWQYIFLYSDTRGEASEDFMKALLDTIDLAFDSDGDGLFDDDEARYGTDPNDVDSDGDGFDDFLEVSNGYNPLGEGELPGA